MINTLRASCRSFLGATFLLVWTCAFVVARPLHRGARVESWRRAFLGGASRGLLRIAGVHVEVEGSRPVGAGFLVTNHLGYLDILVLASRIDAVFVSRADVETWPVLGRLTRWSGTVYLERERRGEIPKVVSQMQDWLGRGTQVVFFPEGTSGSGAAVMPFRSSLFEAAIRTAAPVRCAALHYATHPDDPPARLAVAWWGDMDFGPHLWRLLGLRGVRARICFVPGEIDHTDRKQVAQQAQRAVSAHFEPMGNPESTRA